MQKCRLANQNEVCTICKRMRPVSYTHLDVYKRQILNYSQDEYKWTRGNSSNKLFEYMASGKPIISTVKMGYSIINRYACGIELEECTPEYLAKAIVDYFRMDEDKRIEIGKNARKGVADFNFTVLTDKLEKVIRSVTV